MSEEQQATYDKMEKERVSSFQSEHQVFSKIHILALFNELKKICNRDPNTGKSAKMEWLMDKLPEISELGDKVLIFSQYRNADFGGTEWISSECQEYGPLNYSEANTVRKREKILCDFEMNEEMQIFIGDPRTAGVGLNQLVAANHVVHFDHWWNPAKTSQATARAHRSGQTKPVFVYHLRVENTIEDLIFEKIERKLRLYDEVINGLATEVDLEPEDDVIKDIYNALIKKHGFQPLPDQRIPVSVSMDDLNPREFEELTARLFDAMGFSTRLTKQSGDGGADVIASREIGSSRERIAVQSKHQKSPVGRPVMQSLLGVISADPSFSYGVVVTSSTASREALDFVSSNGRIRVIVRDQLEGLLTRYKVPIRPEGSAK
jgi:hypothetical protein